jgi:16S rRNA C967 or C1407 C5-methylase (RsmB/RsmF family)
MKRQYALLTAAFENLKPGGRIVYSTCSLSRHENEEVIRRFLKRRGEVGQILLEDLAEEAVKWGLMGSVEPWEFGFQVLPDRGGAGPLRWSVIVKN